MSSYSRKLLAKSAQICILQTVITMVHCSASWHQSSLLQQPDPETDLHNPAVWDTSRLYEPAFFRSTGSHQLGDHEHELATIRAPRRKRSPTGKSLAPISQQAKFVDACQSRVEVVTPYYATNSKGKVRTIVNSELMQQAVQVEVCVRPPSATHHWAAHSSAVGSSKCNSQPQCGCEQKYKWHRLLVMDPDDSNGSGLASRGLFMDWFLFPSSCVCRCKAQTNSDAQTISGGKQFLKTITSAANPQSSTTTTTTTNARVGSKLNS